MGTTEYLNLKLTNDTDDQMTFAEWRKLMNGEDADSNMEIIDQAFSEQAMKPGGTTGQVLAKNSDDDFDVKWTNVQSGGGVGTVTTVDSVEPDVDGNISLFRMITNAQLEEIIENPELAEDGVKYYTEDSVDGTDSAILAAYVLTNKSGVTVQDELDEHSATIVELKSKTASDIPTDDDGMSVQDALKRIPVIVFSKTEPEEPIDGMIWVKPI